MSAAERAAAHVRAIAAHPRPAGSDAEAGARAYCSARLAELGFSTIEAPFEYSAAVGRWATPAAGWLLLLVFGLAGVGARRGQAELATIALSAGMSIVALGGAMLGGLAVLRLPMLRRRGINLVATRGEPETWLVAHLDSKSQPVPILVRAAAIVLSVLLWLVALALSAAHWQGADVAGWSFGVCILGALAAVPVALSTVGAASPGALDNATGVATVLLAAEMVDRARPLGVLIPSAEELGLAGARAWAEGRAPRTAINCDGVDDSGALSVMYSGRRPAALARALGEAGSRLGTPVRIHRLLPGVLMDGVALADAGWSVANVSKGTPATLARIHTPGDVAERIRGEGIAEAACLIAETLREVR